MITREQLRAARALLKIDVRTLGASAGVTANTISRYENGKDAMNETLARLRQALESLGVEFLDDNGVRLKK